MGSTGAAECLTSHWETFTEDDFKKYALWGINLLRIPVGYWAFDPDPEPYPTGQTKYLDLAVQWARKYNLKVLIDLHGAPGNLNRLIQALRMDLIIQADEGPHNGIL